MIRKLMTAALLAPIGAVMLMAAPAAAHDGDDGRYWRSDGRYSENWRDDRVEWREQRRDRLRNRREARRDRFEDRRERFDNRWDDRRERFNQRNRLWAEQHQNRQRGRAHALNQGWRSPFWVPPRVQRRLQSRRQHQRRSGPPWPAWRY